MKPLLVLLALALLGVGVTACGGASKGTGSTSQTSSKVAATGNTPAMTSSGATTTSHGTTTTSHGTTTTSHGKDAADGDNDPNSEDDKNILAYGHAANAADMRTIATLVRRYYAAAAADNGTTACSLLFTLLAEVIPEDYGQAPGPPSLRGKTCAVVMTKLFKQQHQLLSTNVAMLKVTGARIGEKRGFALLLLGKTHEQRYIPVHREFGVWKVNSLLDSGLP
jgi:hypothetical protein